ncbi:MAG: hypothetical protein EOO39_47470 [Cytophagaceae bacterium]|nr:MAG: hypothetical protein EOO39_47470 [Cytophagaceae bacterium]
MVLEGDVRTEGTIVTNARHFDSLQKIAVSVHEVRQGLDNNIPSDLIALDRVQYLPLALILTEWITNSMKYAVPVDNVLHIRISLYRQVSGSCIDYADTGLKTGNPPQPNLGMDIVRLLCRQLNGTLTYPTQNPYHYRLLLPGL